MKHTICAILAIAGLLTATNTNAQDAAKDGAEKKKKTSLVISTNGISIESADSAGKATQADKKWTSHVNFDLGVILMQDNTNYNDPSVKSYLNVPANKQNVNLLQLTGKSMNVNIYPFMRSYRALKTAGQRIYITSGLGMQIYNLRYENNITYTRNPATVTEDTISFKKDKLGIDYLNVPLMFTFKTRISNHPTNHKKDRWLVYGAGITAGWNWSTWAKQKSDERGKVKVHDNWNFSKTNDFGIAGFNSCITAEIGLDNLFKLYGSYQVTSLYNNGIEQHPVCIGIRFSGI